MQKIVPNLWFQGNAAEGVEFYEHALPNSRVDAPIVVNSRFRRCGG